MVRELVEVLIDIVERARFKDALKVERLVGDQVAERDADAGQWRFVERDETVSEGDEQKCLRKIEELVVQRVAREHHSDPLPGENDGRERHEEPRAKRQELRLMRCQQVPNRLLNRGYQVESGLRFHDRSPRFRAAATSGARRLHRHRKPH